MRMAGRVIVASLLIAVVLLGTLGLQSGSGTLYFEGNFLTTTYAGLAEGVYSMRFAIFNSAVEGVRLWPATAEYEEHPLVIVMGERFSAELGSIGHPITDAVHAAAAPYVEVSVCQPAGLDCEDFEPLPVRLSLFGPVSLSLETPIASLQPIEEAIDEAGGTFQPLAAEHGHWGAIWNGEDTGLTLISSGLGFALAATTTSDSVDTAGVKGTGKGGFGGLFETESYAPFIAGVMGIGKFGSAKGVFGEARGASVGAAGVYGRASSPTGETSGVLGWTESSTRGTSGVLGYANSTQGETYGVFGQSNSSEGYGLHGLATALSGYTAGVFGESLSELGFGVRGEGQHAGVYGLGTDNSGLSHGILGRTNSTRDGASGVYGFAAAGRGRTYGVYGVTESPEGYGVYSDGNAHIEGELTWKAKMGCVSVSPAAFQPMESDVSYTNRGGSLTCNSAPMDPFAREVFVAPVSLPHGALVKSVEMYLYSKRPKSSIERERADGFAIPSLHLVRSDFGDNWVTMADVEPGGSMESDVSKSFSTSRIASPAVDNSQYTYFLRLRDMPGEFAGMYFLGVVIAYETTGPN